MAVSCPGEILLEIFSRLPRKSLRRFEIVSKEWASLIKEAASLPAKSTDFGFLVIQHPYYLSMQKRIFYRPDDKGALAILDSVSLPSLFEIHMVGCCNGVLFYYGFFSYHLYYPLTKQHANLPGIPQYENSIPRGYGVVPHPETNHFKFIAVHYNTASRDSSDGTKSHGLKVSIFDSETIKWKTKLTKFSDESYEALAPKSKLGHSLASDLCFEQSLYWVECSYLILFCSKTETFRALYVPERSNKCHGVVWESEGRLNYTQRCPIDQVLRFWVLRGGNWETIFHISIPTLDSLLAQSVKFGPLHEPPLKIIWVTAFNEHLQMFHLRTREGVRVCYDIPNKKMTLVSSLFSHLNINEEALLLPITYCKYDLPDLEGTDPDFTTGKRGQSRKRKLSGVAQDLKTYVRRKNRTRQS